MTLRYFLKNIDPETIINDGAENWEADNLLTELEIEDSHELNKEISYSELENCKSKLIYFVNYDGFVKTGQPRFKIV